MAGRCYGATDVGTRLSHDEAAARAHRSLIELDGGGRSFDAIWTSDLSRCRGLAEALALRLGEGVRPCVDARLRELDHGSFEGRAWDEIHATDSEALASWGQAWQTQGPPRGESAEELQRRVEEWIEELDPLGRHLLIGHAGAMRAVLVAQTDLDWTAAMALEVHHLTAMDLA